MELEFKGIIKKLLEKNPDNTQLWDILTALRGPDQDDKSTNLKMFTTERIRGILGLSEDNPFDAMSLSRKLTSVEVGKRNITLSKLSQEHFARHFRCALEALKDLGYDVPDRELDFMC